MPIQDIRIVMTAILIQKETGGNLAEVLEKCAHVIRERFRLKQEIRTKTAQGRLTGWVLSLMPVVLATVLYYREAGSDQPAVDAPCGSENALYRCR